MRNKFFHKYILALGVVTAVLVAGVLPAQAQKGEPNKITEVLKTASVGFVDVPPGAFYTEAVQWLVSNGITTGTSPTTYSPARSVTRGEMAAFLWRRANRPQAPTRCGFTDIPAGAFYDMAVCWLVNQNITTGTSPTTYSPARSVTRGEMAAFLWRAANRPQATTPHHFSDVPPEAFFEVPVRWLRENSVSTGVGDPHTYAPHDTVARAQMAAFLWRSTFLGQPKIILSTLKVEPEVRDGYNRDTVFSGWRDLDRNGCNTRCEVLAREKRFDLPGLPQGGWFSVFDNLTTSNASSFDIDHVIPLAEAWDSGARSWTAEKWILFGNDLDDTRSLRAVSASSNRSKSDRDPAEWMPPATTFRCQYATEWVALKSRWSLSIDNNEKVALTSIFAACPATKTVVLAAPPA